MYAKILDDLKAHENDGGEKSVGETAEAEKESVHEV
jgi:hypothetical protein